MSGLWLWANDLIDRADEIRKRDGTIAMPYNGHAHLYSGPHDKIHGYGRNILGYNHDIHSNHTRAKYLSKIYGGLLIDDMNVSRELVDNVDGTGLNVYDYFLEAYAQDKELAYKAADHVMRRVSELFVNDIYGVVDTSCVGAARDRVFFDTEYPVMMSTDKDILTKLVKSKTIEIVNDDSILQIRRPYNLQAEETAYRVMCMSEQDKLCRTAWKLCNVEIMRHYLDVEEFYRIDREQMWTMAAKEIFNAKVGRSELIALDRKMNAWDRERKATHRIDMAPKDRLEHKERQLFKFVVGTMAKRASPAPR